MKPTPGFEATPFVATISDVTPGGQLKLSMYLDWLMRSHMQADHALGIFWGPYWLRKGRLWVYGRYKIDWVGQAEYAEPVVVKTHVSELLEKKYKREFEMLQQATRRVIARAQVETFFIDANTLRPTAMEEETFQALASAQQPPGVTSGPTPPADPPPPTGEIGFDLTRPIQFDELDVFSHVSNVVYLRWATDAIACYLLPVLGPEAPAQAPVHLAIRYRVPLQFGDAITVRGRLDATHAHQAIWAIEIIAASTGATAATLSLITTWSPAWTEQLILHREPTR